LEWRRKDHRISEKGTGIYFECTHSRMGQWEGIDGDLYTFAKKEVLPVQILINGETISAPIHNGYAQLKRSWCDGDVVKMNFRCQSIKSSHIMKLLKMKAE